MNGDFLTVETSTMQEMRQGEETANTLWIDCDEVAGLAMTEKIGVAADGY